MTIRVALSSRIEISMYYARVIGRTSVKLLLEKRQIVRGSSLYLTLSTNYFERKHQIP